jgi:hypothetical protein
MIFRSHEAIEPTFDWQGEAEDPWQFAFLKSLASLSYVETLRRFDESPDATECSAESLDFGTEEGRSVEAAFDGGLVASDAGTLLLGATDRAIRLMDRFASCFHDVRRPEWIEFEDTTLVGQRVFGIALGYEDLNDHDELRHDLCHQDGSHGSDERMHANDYYDRCGYPHRKGFGGAKDGQ